MQATPKSIKYSCPCNIKSNIIFHDNYYTCADNNCAHSFREKSFPIVNGIPLLISEVNCDTIFSRESPEIHVKRSNKKQSSLKKLIIGTDSKTIENRRKFISEVYKISASPKILVIGSGEMGSGTEELWSNAGIEIHGIDVYMSDTVDAICDAHYLPFKNESYDGIWIQAVLEHVVQPNVVVDEIYRTLKVNGIVYAETPFMQQVHEGAYDFTRYTVLGHRYLFKNFQSIDFGGNGGPEIVVAWSIRYFIWSVTRSKRIGRLFGLTAGLLLRPFKIFSSSASMHDASSGVFFLGRKFSEKKLTHTNLIQLYRGQFK